MSSRPETSRRDMPAGTDTKRHHRAVVHGGEGEARWWFDTLALIKLAAPDTGGQLTVIEIVDRPGHYPPVVSHRYDMVLWILDGGMHGEVGEEAFEAGVGDLVHIPRGVAHGYTIGDSGCRHLLISTPAGMEEAVRAVSRPAENATLPSSAGPAISREELVTILAAHGFEPVG